MPNRLKDETSPYLLQHADNPVDWYPWGPEALGRAKAENKPILLSIGYSACHWCHVMEHESFENPAIAALMNELFVNVKVDREERPDLDSIYMSAVQAMTGRGGWPMTVFLTPEGVPYYGGTYFPPEDRGHMPGFPRVLKAVGEAYASQAQEVIRNAEQMREMLQCPLVPTERGGLDRAMLDAAEGGILRAVDRREGGVGGAPKFPQPMPLEFLLRSYVRTGNPLALDAVTLSLDKMAAGGIYDQLGGGFHRYATDGIWLVPHFEKMLYDNAQLARIYLQAYLVTGAPRYRQIVEETLAYVQREMTDPAGGFYSTQYADSEGEEGKFFVWHPDEVDALLGSDDARLFSAYFDVSAGGNFEGHNILHTTESAESVARMHGVSVERLHDAIERGRSTLFDAREARIKPARDEKVLAAWNGMMLRAFAEAAAALDRADYREVAVRNATFLTNEMVRDGRVLRSWKDGTAKLNGYLEDYANLADGLIATYEATFDARWIDRAREVVDVMIEQFTDDANGGFFDTGRDHEQLVSRPKDIFDNATPSGNAVAADALQRLALLTNEERYRQAAAGVLDTFGAVAAKHPTGFGRLLSAVDLALGEAKEIAIVGHPDAADTRALVRAVFERFVPNRVVAVGAPGDDTTLPLLEGRGMREGRATAYVCQDYVCQAPVTAVAELVAQLSDS